MPSTRPPSRAHAGRPSPAFPAQKRLDLAGVSETTVRNALRAARGLGLLTLEERRLTAWRNAPNVVRVVSRDWQAWLRLRASKERARGGGCKLVKPTPTQENNRGTSAQRNRAWAAEG